MAILIGGISLDNNSIDQRKQRIHLIIAELIGAFVVSGLAFLFHFLYEWSGKNAFVGLFSATNESVFEHTKILFYPFLLYAIVEFSFVCVDIKRFFVAKAITSISLIAIVITFFYTYTGIIGYHIPLVDMISAIAYAFLAALLSYFLLQSKWEIQGAFLPITMIFIAVVSCMIMFTIIPPNIPLFTA